MQRKFRARFDKYKCGNKKILKNEKFAPETFYPLFAEAINQEESDNKKMNTLQPNGINEQKKDPFWTQIYIPLFRLFF